MTKEPKGYLTPGACSALKELAASQAREAKPREAIEYVTPMYLDCDIVNEALALPFDDSALQERLKQELERRAKVCDAFGGSTCYSNAIRALT